MNLVEFQEWRDEAVRSCEVIRLDCMNPFIALSGLVPEVGREICSDQDALEAWSNASDFPLPEPKTRVWGRGVRAILAAIFESQAHRLGTLWLPADVYPVYGDLAKNLPRRTYAIQEEEPFEFLSQTGPSDSILLPLPVSPTGRDLSGDDRESIVAWLNAGTGRHLIVDAVYDFGGISQPCHERIITIRSTSKSWLCRQVLGVANVPENWRTGVQGELEELDREEVSRAKALFSRSNDFGPTLLQQSFEIEWQRIDPLISSIFPDWSPPATGYFSTIPENYETLLSMHSILSVPASVFGSSSTGRSVITCLHDLVANRERDL